MSADGVGYRGGAAVAPPDVKKIRRAEDPALGDDRGDQRGRGHVEGGVVDGRVRRRRLLGTDPAHFVAVALLDGNLRPGGERGVDRRERRRDVERHPVMAGQHGDPIGADLVRGVAVGGDAVGAGDHEVDLAARHHRRRRHVGDQPVGDALAVALPRGEPRSLHDRPGLVHPHQRDLALRVGRADDAERGAVTRGGERARVAVREDARARGHQRRAVGAERAVSRHVLLEDRLGLVEQPRAHRGDGLAANAVGHPPHPFEGPEEIDGGRPRGGQALRRGLEIGEQIVDGLGTALARGQRDPEGGGHTDGRRPADDERADRLGHVFPPPVLPRLFLARQAGLIEEQQAVAGPADRSDHRSCSRSARRERSSSPVMPSTRTTLSRPRWP